MKDKSYYEQFLIHEFQFWNLYLYVESFNYLGRVYISLKRDDVLGTDFVAEEEYAEYRQIRQLVLKMWQQLFQPTHPNWAELANLYRHCHIHCIPRYNDGTPVFNGVRYPDRRKNRDYKPLGRRIEVDEPTKHALCAQMAETISQIILAA